MDKIKKLPDAEFEIMKVVWTNEEPITTNVIMKNLGDGKDWKIQTVVSLMARLVERGFLRTEKHGKERDYYAAVGRDDYLRFETGNFMRVFHDNSFLNLVNTVYSNAALSDTDIDELLEWAKDQKGRRK